MHDTRAWQALTAVGSVLLGGSLFLPWFHVDSTGLSTLFVEHPASTAWDWIQGVSVVLLILAVAASAATLILRRARTIWPALVAVGLTAAGLVTYRLLSPPAASPSLGIGGAYPDPAQVRALRQTTGQADPRDALRALIDVDPSYGAFIGLAGALLIAGAGLLALRAARRSA